MKLIPSILCLGALICAGCQHTGRESGRHFSIHIESWDDITFVSPAITQDRASRILSRKEAESVFAAYRSQMTSSAEVSVGKPLHMNDDTLDAELDKIQDWLIEMGMTKIIFRLAVSDLASETPTVREYRNGKVIP